MPQFEPIFTFGNLLNIIAVILSFVGIFVKITRFMAQSEMDRKNLHEKILAIDARCNDCILKTEVETLKSSREKMNEKQIELRAELPLKLDEIWKELTAIRQIVEKR